MTKYKKQNKARQDKTNKTRQEKKEKRIDKIQDQIQKKRNA